MKSANNFSIYKFMMMITLPFLYLFNLGFIVFGVIVAWRSLLDGNYLVTIGAVLTMVVLPIVIVILNNPKKVWRAINKPLGEK